MLLALSEPKIIQFSTQRFIFNPSTVDYDKKSLKTVLELNKATKLVLPNFQRGFVWKEDQQQRLLTSFLLELPIGSILTLEGTSENFAARDICTPQEIIPNQDCFYLLDGQQRVSTLKAIFSDLIEEGQNWKQSWNTLFSDLRNRWFIKLDGDDTSDFFGFNTLKFDSTKFKTGEPEQLADYIISKKILVKNITSWFHPGYSLKDDAGVALSSAEKRKKVAIEAAQELLVPLYELYDSNIANPLHKLVLERVSTKKAHDLKAEYENNESGAIALLSDAEQDISDFYRDKDTENINIAWSKLAISWAKDVRHFLEKTLEYELSQINLPADEIARAIATFESINKPGTPLDVYDLIAAKAARNPNLPTLSARIKTVIDEDLDDINAITSRVVGAKPAVMTFEHFSLMSDNATPAKVVRNQFLNLLSLFTHVSFGDTSEIDKVDYIKRTKILGVKTEDINDQTAKIITSLKRAFTFLHIRCGIEKPSSLNYELMILPIAYVLANNEFWSSGPHIDKIEYWYWSSLLSGAYRDNQNSRCVSDIKDLYEWLNGGMNPFTNRAENIFNAQGYSDIKVLMGEDPENSVPTAIHEGILRYILSRQPHDFIKADPEIRLNSWDIASKRTVEINDKKYELSVQDHHIFPLSVATSLFESSRELRSQPKHPLNSPLNRTYISAAANSIISDATTNKYFPQVSQHAQDDHCLPPHLKTVYEQLPGEEDKTYYLRLLQSRFDILSRDVRMELVQLSS